MLGPTLPEPEISGLTWQCLGSCKHWSTLQLLSTLVICMTCCNLTGTRCPFQVTRLLAQEQILVTHQPAILLVIHAVFGLRLWRIISHVHSALVGLDACTTRLLTLSWNPAQRKESSLWASNLAPLLLLG